MTTPTLRSFASDNYAGAHPEVMQAMVAANAGHAGSYGNDPYTEEATAHFRRHFGEQARVLFAFNGTGANVLGLASITESYHSVLCTDVAHLNVDESTAPETFTHCRLVPLASVHGKLTPEAVARRIIRRGDVHHPQPRVVALTQTTEYGTVYSLDEMKALSAVARDHGLLVHLDGARLFNAAASLGCSLRALTTEVGVDVVSVGGTKNGMVLGEAVVFLNPELAERVANQARFRQKQAMQLASKQRFIAAQFTALLRGDLWRRNAAHANRLAARLAEGMGQLPAVRLTQPTQANAVFATLPPAAIAPLQAIHPFYVWNELTHEVRWMCAFDTTEADVDSLISHARSLV